MTGGDGAELETFQSITASAGSVSCEGVNAAASLKEEMDLHELDVASVRPITLLPALRRLVLSAGAAQSFDQNRFNTEKSTPYSVAVLVGGSE